MQADPYLEHSYAVLQTRLKNPAATAPAATKAAALPFVTISREVCAGATTVGQLLVPMLNSQTGDEGEGWALFDKNLLIHALTQQNLEESLAKFLPEDRRSEINGAIGEFMGLHPSLWQLEHQVSGGDPPAGPCWPRGLCRTRGAYHHAVPALRPSCKAGRPP